MKTIQIELNDFLAAIIGIAAGLLLLVFPQEAINVITYGIGIVSLVYGVVRIVDYFKNRDISPFFAGELILGVVLVGIGLFSFLNPGGIFAILPIIFGILVLVEGISLSGDNISGAIWGCMGYTVLLCFTLFKTGSLAKSLFGAH